jgi:hypothetical protein
VQLNGTIAARASAEKKRRRWACLLGGDHRKSDGTTEKKVTRGFLRNIGLSAAFSGNVMRLYFGLAALAGMLFLFEIWLAQHEQQAAIDRLERYEILRWSRLSEQQFRVDKWSFCQS